MTQGFSGGSQCTPIALLALIFGGFHIGPTAWIREHIDHIIFEGDLLYTDVVRSRYSGNLGVYLAHDDLPEQVTLPSESYAISLMHTFYGQVGYSMPDGNSPAVTLHTALQLSFSQTNWVLCTFGHETISLMQDAQGHYHLFDSHARGPFGQVAPDGAAVLLTFSDIESLYPHLKMAYSSYMFNISPMSIVHKQGTDQFEKLSNESTPRKGKTLKRKKHEASGPKSYICKYCGKKK